MSPATFRGVAIGLWALAGLAFLADALLPHAGKFHVFAPWLLAVAVGCTVFFPAEYVRPRGDNQKILWFAGLILALGISFVMIRGGTGRSFLFVLLTILAVVVLTFPKKNPA